MEGRKFSNLKCKIFRCGVGTFVRICRTGRIAYIVGSDSDFVRCVMVGLPGLCYYGSNTVVNRELNDERKRKK